MNDIVPKDPALDRTVGFFRTGAPDVLQAFERDRPTPDANEVLVRNAAAGVNVIDTLFRNGSVPADAMPPLPHVPGVEGAGVVVAMGDGVTGLEIGQRVFWFGRPGAGGYGPYSVVGAAFVVTIADTITFAQAAATPVAFATAHHMLFDYGRLPAGAFVLVRSAAGGVGSAALQLARNAGLRPIGIASAGKESHLFANGAIAAIDYVGEDVIARVAAITGGAGISLALNATSGTTIAEDLATLAPFGQVVSFGHLAGPPAGSAAELLMPWFSRSVGIRVSDIYTHYDRDPDGMRRILQMLASDLAAGRIDPHVDRTFPATDAASAHRLLESGEARGKIVLLHETET